MTQGMLIALMLSVGPPQAGCSGAVWGLPETAARTVSGDTYPSSLIERPLTLPSGVMSMAGLTSLNVLNGAVSLGAGATAEYAPSCVVQLELTYEPVAYVELGATISLAPGGLALHLEVAVPIVDPLSGTFAYGAAIGIPFRYALSHEVAVHLGSNLISITGGGNREWYPQETFASPGLLVVTLSPQAGLLVQPWQRIGMDLTAAAVVPVHTIVQQNGGHADSSLQLDAAVVWAVRDFLDLQLGVNGTLSSEISGVAVLPAITGRF